MPEEPLRRAHSLAEAHKWLMVEPCAACRAGRRAVTSTTVESEHIDAIVRLDLACQRCGVRTSARFAIDPAQVTQADPPVINTTREPSTLLDVAQWMALFRTYLAETEHTPDRTETRRLGYEAALCLDEALKFYDDDNDLPPDRAFFHEERRLLARSQPAAFTRTRLLAQRGKLPTLGAMARTMMAPKRKRWWQLWR